MEGVEGRERVSGSDKIGQMKRLLDRSLNLVHFE